MGDQVNPGGSLPGPAGHSRSLPQVWPSGRPMLAAYAVLTPDGGRSDGPVWLREPKRHVFDRVRLRPHRNETSGCASTLLSQPTAEISAHATRSYGVQDLAPQARRVMTKRAVGTGPMGVRRSVSRPSKSSYFSTTPHFVANHRPLQLL
jgi:hypothetical protein